MEALINGVLALGAFGLMWLGFARLLHTKSEWKYEKKATTEGIWAMLGLLVVAGFVLWLATLV